MLDEQVAKKKQAKKIFLITNGSDETTYSEDKAKQLAKKAKSLDTKINIIAIDFTDDVDSKDDDENLTDVQKKNKKLLH